MREIGPHKYKSYITPPNYDDGEHWLSATDYSEKVRVMLLQCPNSASRTIPGADGVCPYHQNGV